MTQWTPPDQLIIELKALTGFVNNAISEIEGEVGSGQTDYDSAALDSLQQAKDLLGEAVGDLGSLKVLRRSEGCP